MRSELLCFILISRLGGSGSQGLTRQYPALVLFTGPRRAKTLSRGCGYDWIPSISGGTVSRWAAEDGGGGVHVDASSWEQWERRPPIPMLWERWGQLRRGALHLWDAHLSSDLWEGAVRKSGRRANGRDEGSIIRRPHTLKSLLICLTHTCAAIKSNTSLPNLCSRTTRRF